MGKHIGTEEARTEAFRVLQGFEKKATSEKVLTLLRRVCSKKRFLKDFGERLPRKTPQMEKLQTLTL
jgi:hypothetical protein